MLIGKWGSFKAIHRICKERTQTYTFIRVIYSPRGKRYLMVFYLLVIIFIILIIDMYFPVMIQLVLVLPSPEIKYIGKSFRVFPFTSNVSFPASPYNHSSLVSLPENCCSNLQSPVSGS